MNRSILLLGGTAALLALTATGALAASAQDFIKEAIQGDNSEIMLGQLAQQKAGSQKVKDFGKMLVNDHTLAKRNAAAVAKTIGVTPPDEPMPEAQDESNKLSQMSGDAFDREFASYMVTDHQKDIQKFKDQVKANDPQTSALAGQTLPVLQKHLQTAQSLTGNAAQNGDAAAAATLSQAPTEESPNEWRASKLAGVAVYGPDNKKVGNITDVLMTRDGKAVSVVVGVGGFLGIGEKDVAIPYDQVTFTDQPMATTLGNADNAAATGGAANGAGMAPAAGTNAGMAPAAGTDATGAGQAAAPTVGLGSPPADATGNATTGASLAAVPPNPAAAANRSMAYPDHGMIDMTADQLKKAPTFKFAR